MLSDRRQRVLAALIEEYISHALPVGSRTLVENYRLGVSSATVRNELSVLEDAGYIKQPHTSAGRIPTDFGYRAFVDDLLGSYVTEEDLDEDSRRAARALKDSALELDDLMDRTTSALARLTECLSIVLPPQTLSLSVRQITLVALSARRVMIVVVTEEGQVLDRQVECPCEVSPDEVHAVQETLNALIVDKQPDDIPHHIDEEQFPDHLTRLLIRETLRLVEEGSAGRAHQEGLKALVRQPEFAQAQALMPVLAVLEDDTILLRILHDVDSDGNTTVRIGSENGAASLAGVSVVAGRYGRGHSEGIVAVIGPTRMNYAQVIKAVRTAQSALGDTDA